MTGRPALASLLISILLAGCGGSGEEPAPAPAPEPTAPPRETLDHLPKLPRSWHPFVDRRGGFAAGLPRGWKARPKGPGVLIRSYDHLVAVSIAAERGDDALAVALGDFATRTADALPGFRGEPRREQMRRFDHRYEAAEVRARATATGGVDQRVSVLVLRRDSVATVTAVIAANVKRAADPSLRLARRVIETLRTRPPRD